MYQDDARCGGHVSWEESREAGTLTAAGGVEQVQPCAELQGSVSQN